MDTTKPNPMFAKFDQALGKTTPTATDGQAPVTSRANEIRALAKPPATKPTLGSKIGSDIQNRGEQFYGAITGTSEESKGENDMTRGIQAFGHASQGVTDIAGDVVGSLLDHLGLSKENRDANLAAAKEKNPDFYKTNPLAEGIKSKVTETGSKAYDELGIRFNELIQNHPALGKELESALKKTEGLGNTANMVLTGDATAKTLQTGVNTTKKVINTVQEKASNLNTKADAYAEKSLKADWSKPSETNKAGFKKPNEIYRQAADGGHDISDTLVKNKISLSDNIQDGKYATVDTADNLRGNTQKMYKDVLRPSLQQADYSTPRTPTEDVVNGAVENINKNKYLTQETKDTLIQKLESTRGALQKQFPEGMSLTEIGDEKIVRDINAKYNVLGDIASNNEAAKNKAVADSLRTMLEDKAPPGIPVHEFNAELAKQYQAADYLESLNTKTVPKSIASRIAQTTAKVVGATVGHGVGGGILGGVGGYHIGGMLEGMLENIPNPFKASFLKNLEVTNPEAFQAISDYMGAEEVAKLQRPGLPSPRYIPMGGEAPAESTVTSEAARKNPVSANPKTGKFQTSYSSTPKSLDQSDSVAHPMTKTSNSSMSKNITQAEEKVKDFVKNPKMGLSVENITKNISSGEKGTLRDFTDYVNGAYEPSAKELKLLKADVQDIAKKYGFSKAFSGDKALSNQIGEYLDKIGYLKGEGVIPEKLQGLAKEAQKYESVEKFKSNLTSKQYRELLNEEYGGQGKGAGAKMTGATKRSYGDYIYSQDRGMFDAHLSDVKNNINPHESQFITDFYNKVKKK